MKTKLFSIVFSVMFIFIVHMKAGFVAYRTIEAKKIDFDYAYIKLENITRIGGVDQPDNGSKIYIPLSSIHYIEEEKE